MAYCTNRVGSGTEFLKVDFPRIPYPTSAEEFAELASLGRELRELHLLTSPQLQQPITNFRIAGSNVVERYHRGADGSVWINDNQYFANVPPRLGLLHRRLPARTKVAQRTAKPEALTLHDLQHYQRLITALYRTTLLHPSE